MMRSTTAVNWQPAQWQQAPAWQRAEGFCADGVTALWYEGVPWRGAPTRVFAWYGAPAHPAATPAPAMVLVHGGGGTAFAEWVRLWTARGYAALAMDTCGCVPRGEYGAWERHPDGGPAGWGGLAAIDESIEDQWTYHAVHAVLRGHALLRAFPEVDPARIGITGISWGGYLTCLAAGLDDRFRCAAPVYGCGFLGEDSCWLPNFAEMGAERAARWLSLWDPSHYLPQVHAPMLWVTGTNDFAYPMGSWQRSYRLPATPRTLCLRVNMAHGHDGPGEKPEEIHAFANHHLRDGAPLLRITAQGSAEGRAWACYDAACQPVRAELHYTTDTGPWQPRAWHTLAAEIDPARQQVSAPLPADATAAYLNLLDARELVVSSEHEEWPRA